MSFLGQLLRYAGELLTSPRRIENHEHDRRRPVKNRDSRQARRIKKNCTAKYEKLVNGGRRVATGESHNIVKVRIWLFSLDDFENAYYEAIFSDGHISTQEWNYKIEGNLLIITEPWLKPSPLVSIALYRVNGNAIEHLGYRRCGNEVAPDDGHLLDGNFAIGDVFTKC